MKTFLIVLIILVFSIGTASARGGSTKFTTGGKFSGHGIHFTHNRASHAYKVAI